MEGISRGLIEVLPRTFPRRRKKSTTNLRILRVVAEIRKGHHLKISYSFNLTTYITVILFERNYVTCHKRSLEHTGSIKHKNVVAKTGDKRSLAQWYYETEKGMRSFSVVSHENYSHISNKFLKQSEFVVIKWDHAHMRITCSHYHRMIWSNYLLLTLLTLRIGERSRRSNLNTEWMVNRVSSAV
jgi:hypothetical protein